MPFVILMDGRVYAAHTPNDATTDLALSRGAKGVIAAGRMHAVQGRLTAITNESLAYHPSFEQMAKALQHLSDKGFKVSGVLLIVYSELDANGLGLGGKAYRVVQEGGRVGLVEEKPVRLTGEKEGN